MNILDHKKLVSLQIPVKESIQWVDEALRIKNTAIVPAKISMKPSKDVFYNIMPTVIPSLSVSGIKIVRRYPHNMPSLDSEILIYNLENGKPIALLDGNFITTLRTGSVAAHSINLLAKKDFKQVAWIGLGNTAKATAKSLLSIYENRDFVFVIKKYKNAHNDFKKYIDNIKGTNRINFVVEESITELMKDADVIISSVTYKDTDFCDPSIYKPGVLIVPIHTRGFMACDTVFDKVYADDISHIKHFNNFDKITKVSEVADVLDNPSLGRTTDSEKIIVYNIGLSLHDIYHSKKIIENLSMNNFPEICLNKPYKKHWFK